MLPVFKKFMGKNKKQKNQPSDTLSKSGSDSNELSSSTSTQQVSKDSAVKSGGQSSDLATNTPNRAGDRSGPSTLSLAPSGSGSNVSVSVTDSKMEEKKKRFRGQKRPRKPATSASTPSPGAPVKRPNLEQASGSFAEAAATKKMAIIPEGFPERMLSSTEMFNLQNELDILIDDAAEGHEPRFSNAALSNGALIMHCIGADSVEFLKSINGRKFDSLDTAVKTLDAAELPKPYKLIFKTKNHGLTDQSILLRRLAKQNPGLSTAGWRVLSKDKAPTYMRWVLEIPEKAATFIRQHNNELFCGAFGKGLCKLIGSASAPPSSTLTTPVVEPPSEEEEMQVSSDIADVATTDSQVGNPTEESDEVGKLSDNLLSDLGIHSDSGSDVTVISNSELLRETDEFTGLERET